MYMLLTKLKLRRRYPPFKNTGIYVSPNMAQGLAQNITNKKALSLCCVTSSLAGTLDHFTKGCAQAHGHYRNVISSRLVVINK